MLCIDMSISWIRFVFFSSLSIFTAVRILVAHNHMLHTVQHTLQCPALFEFYGFSQLRLNGSHRINISLLNSEQTLIRQNLGGNMCFEERQYVWFIWCGSECVSGIFFPPNHMCDSRCEKPRITWSQMMKKMHKS